jgi:uncharacterized membrane protein YhaH (DUF805 family)
MTLRGLFKFEGRATRSHYWVVFGIAITIVIVAFTLAEYVLDIPLLSKETSTYSGGEIVLHFAISLGITLVMLPVTLRRLHDRNKGLKWLAFYTIGGLLFDLVDVYSLSFLNLPPISQDTVYTIYGIAGLITVFSLIDLGFLRGTEGTNFYGPDPLTGGSAEPSVFD